MGHLHSFLLFILALANIGFSVQGETIIAPPARCETDGWSLVPGLVGKCLKVFPDHLSKVEASALCSRNQYSSHESPHLLQLRTKEEEDAVIPWLVNKTRISGGGNSWIWLDLSGQGTGRHYHNALNWTWSSDGRAPNYSNWASWLADRNAPNDPHKLCAELQIAVAVVDYFHGMTPPPIPRPNPRMFHWTDASCNEQKRVVCERKDIAENPMRSRTIPPPPPTIEQEVSTLKELVKAIGRNFSIQAQAQNQRITALETEVVNLKNHREQSYPPPAYPNTNTNWWYGYGSGR